MAKKDLFVGGISSLIGKIEQPTAGAQREEIPKEAFKTAIEQRKKRGGRPRTNFREITKASQEGCKENEVRATFILNEKLLEEFKRIAWQKRLKVKEAADLMLKEFIAAHSKEKE